MLKINTVTGTCTPQELGTTLVHEHLLIAWSGWEADSIVVKGFKRDETLKFCRDDGSLLIAATGETITAMLSESTRDRTPSTGEIRSGPSIAVLSFVNTSADRKSTRLNSSHLKLSRMPSSA